MAKDRVGNEIKEGDLILFQNVLMTVSKIMDSGILSGSGTVAPGSKVQGMIIPGTLVCSIGIQFNPATAIDCLVLKNPNPQVQDGKPN